MGEELGDKSPLIGITGPRLLGAEISTTPPILLDARVDSHYAYYPAAVAAAGGMPVHLPRDNDPRELIHRLDGLIIGGGQDVDPRSFGRQPTPITTRLDPARDRFEADLIRAALEHDVPLLGICRGAQLLNVTLGGSLVLNLLEAQQIEHARWVYPVDHRSHPVTCVAGSAVGGVYGAETMVNSFHHQAIGDLGDGVLATAMATDGTVEAIEIEGARAIGVQWHPEMLKEPDRIFEWLVGHSTNDGARPRLERSAV